MHNTSRVSLIAGLVLAVSSGTALAQAKKKPAAPPPAMTKPAPVTSTSGGVGAGDTEIGFFGNISDNELSTTITLGLTFGRFVSDDLELRLTQILVSDDTDGVSTLVYSPYVSGEFLLRQPGSPLVPYIGGGAGLFMLGNDDIFIYNLFLTPTAGVKYFLNERTSVEYALSYQFPLIGEACDDFDCFDVDVTTLSNSLRFNIYY